MDRDTLAIVVPYIGGCEAEIERTVPLTYFLNVLNSRTELNCRGDRKCRKTLDQNRTR